MMAFKDELKKLREQDGLSQGELAAKLKVGRSTISMWESGKREPGFEMLEAIADYFNVNMNRLLPKAGKPAADDGNGSDIISLYWSLSSADRAVVDSMILRLSSKGKK